MPDEDKKQEESKQAAQDSGENQSVEDVLAEEKPKKKRKRRRKRKKKKPSEPLPAATPEEKAAAPAEDFLLEEQYLGSDEGNVPTPGEAEKQPAPEPTPEGESEFNLGEPTKGPVGWDSLKEAIKEDHEATKEKLGAEKTGEVAEAEEPEITEAPEEEMKEEAVVGEVIEEAPEVEEKKEEVVASVAKAFEPTEDEAERKEIIRIITKYALGGCVLIILIIGTIFFQLPQRIYNFTVGLFQGGEPVTVEEPQDTVRVPSGDLTPGIETSLLAGEDQVKTLERFEPGVRTSIISGESIPIVRRINPGIRTGFMFGLPEPPEQMFDIIASYMDVLMRLQNAFSTDIHQLLDNSNNRENTLTLHLRELKDLQEEALFTLDEVNTLKDELKIEFNEVTTEKNRLETDFFVATEKLEGNKANALLNEFIVVSQEQIDLRAKFNALDKLSRLYDIATRNMDARIRDIELNRKALIEGVRVVDISGSDLELIVDESELN